MNVSSISSYLASSLTKKTLKKQDRLPLDSRFL